LKHNSKGGGGERLDFYRERLVREEEETSILGEEENLPRSALLMQSRSRVKIGGAVMSG